MPSSPSGLYPATDLGTGSVGDLRRVVKASLEEIAASLTGDYRPELVFILQQELQLYEFYQAQITACDTQIEQCESLHLLTRLIS